MGVDVGERWSASAAGWPGAPEAGHYAFNDLHAVLSLVGAGRLDDADRVVEAARGEAASPRPSARWRPMSACR
jgi:hypothetical protein